MSGALEKYLNLRRTSFVESLSDCDMAILQQFPDSLMQKQITLLISRRACEGELDIFCGYHRGRNDEGQDAVYAVYLTLHGCGPLMLLEEETVKERITNATSQNLPCDQSRQALANWPR
jgi:hypothetical protein